MVRIVQLLCPERHCLLAVAYEEGVGSFVEARDALQAMVSKGPFNNWCALCGSRDLHFEEGVTKFQTLEEAGPSLGATMAENAMARAALDQAGMTYEKRRLN
jgi:hypothetical protein